MYLVKTNPFHIEEKPKIKRAMTSSISAKNPDVATFFWKDLV